MVDYEILCIGIASLYYKKEKREKVVTVANLIYSIFGDDSICYFRSKYNSFMSYFKRFPEIFEITKVDRMDYLCLVVSDYYVMEHYPHTAVFEKCHGFSTHSVHCLHAGDLKPSTTEGDLVTLFNKFGPLHKVMIREKNGRRLAFIQFYYEKSAINAKNTVNRTSYWTGSLQFAKRNTDNIKSFSAYTPILDTYFDNQMDKVCVKKTTRGSKKDNQKIVNKTEMIMETSNTKKPIKELSAEECKEIEKHIKQIFQSLVMNQYIQTSMDNPRMMNIGLQININEYEERRVQKQTILNSHPSSHEARCNPLFGYQQNNPIPYPMDMQRSYNEAYSRNTQQPIEWNHRNNIPSVHYSQNMQYSNVIATQRRKYCIESQRNLDFYHYNPNPINSAYRNSYYKNTSDYSY